MQSFCNSEHLLHFNPVQWCGHLIRGGHLIHTLRYVTYHTLPRMVKVSSAETVFPQHECKRERKLPLSTRNATTVLFVMEFYVTTYHLSRHSIYIVSLLIKIKLLLSCNASRLHSQGIKCCGVNNKITTCHMGLYVTINHMSRLSRHRYLNNTIERLCLTSQAVNFHLLYSVSLILQRSYHAN